MPSRRRKKPPDPPFASLLFFPCCYHGLAPDRNLPSPCNSLKLSELGHCERNGAVSRHTPSRSTTDLPATYRLCPNTTIWAATHLAGDFWSSVDCSSVWPGSSVRPPSGYYLKITVRAVILRHPGMPQRLPSESHGKRFGYFDYASTIREVWFCRSLSFWVPPFPHVASLFCFDFLVRRSSSRNGVSSVYLHSLGLADLINYTSFYLSLRAYSFWWIVLVSVFSFMARFSPPSSLILAQFDDLTSATKDLIRVWTALLELWGEDTLNQLLQHVGQFIRFDAITINWSTGKYARVVLYFWLLLCPVGAIWTAPFPLLFRLELIWKLFLLCTHSISPLFFGGDDRDQGYQLIVLTPLLWELAVCKCPHEFLISRQLPMNVFQTYRTSLHMSMLRILSEQAKAGFDNAVNWACPSFLLSLLLAKLHAQIHDSECYCICWHLILLQTGWDEVKGLWPPVCEDIFSETKICSLLVFVLVPSLSSICCHCLLLFLHNDWFAQQEQWIILIKDMLTKQWLFALVSFPSLLITFAYSVITGCLPSFYLQRQEMQMQVSQCAVGFQDQALVFCISTSWLYLDMYWIYMTDLFFLSYVLVPAGKGLSEILSYLFQNCTLWFVWVVAQHICVLGLCRTALAQHRRMLRLAQRGFGPKKFATQHNCVLGPCLTALEQHRRVLGPCLMALDQHLRMFGQVLVLQVMLVVDQVQCIDSHSVNCIPGCCTPSGISCNSSIIRILEQHLCVLGLCLMALELHLWMPSPAHYGCRLFRDCALMRYHRLYCLPKLKREMNFATLFVASSNKKRKTGQIRKSFTSASELWSIIAIVFNYEYSDPNGPLICIIGLFIMLNVFADFSFGRAGFGLPRRSLCL